MKSADNFCYVGGEVTFFITEVYRNSDNQENLLPLFWLPGWVPGQGLDPIYMLEYLYSKPSKLTVLQKAYALGVTGADGR
jgi:hypothetical protein